MREKFVCPKCGGPYFGRDIGMVDGKWDGLPTVRCHGDSSGGKRDCDWHGVWPNPSQKVVSRQLGLRVSQELYDTLTEEAAKSGATMQVVVVKIVSEHFGIECVVPKVGKPQKRS